MAGIFKQVGVQAVVKDFAKYIQQIGQMTKSSVQSSHDIAEAIKREELHTQKLRLQRQLLHEQEMKIVASGKATQTRLDLLTVRQKEYTNRIVDSRQRLEELRSTTEGASISYASLARELGGIVAVMGAVEAAERKLIKSTGVVGAAGNILGRVVMGALHTITLNPAAIGDLYHVIKGVVTLVKQLASGIGGAFDIVKSIVGGVVNVFRTVGDVIGAVFNAAKGIVEGFVNVVKSVASVVAGPFVAAFKWAGGVVEGLFNKGVQLAEKALHKLSLALKQVAQDAWEGAERFQALAIRFEGLVANEIIMSGATEDFGKALEMAERPAANMLSWMQRLAVTTPFSRRDISETVAFSMAMGFSAAEVKNMTLAIGEFVAGMGLESETMERIILQFGQMKSGGRLYGTELRDLARGAFVPINEIIKNVAASLEMTSKEWQDLAARGQTDIQPFFDEFIRMANERFPNAMERMNNTLIATKQNLQDFVTEFLGVKMLGPLIDVVSSRINGALSMMLSDDVMGAFQTLGSQIAGIAERLFDMADALAEALFGTSNLETMAIHVAAFISVVLDQVDGLLGQAEGKVDDFADGIKQVAVDAFNWGVNIALSLAEGIVKGAAAALTAAMNYISRLLSNWLSPGSPPKVAPLIDIWGMDAMNEFLHGMTLADFDILEGIQGPLKSALDILESGGFIGDAAGKYVKISEQIMKALQGDTVDKTIFDTIASSVKGYGDELATLAKAYVELAEASTAAEQAQLALERAQTRYNDATMQIIAQTQEYNKALREGADINSLRSLKDRINASEEDREIAKDQIGVAEDQLDAAEERVGVAEDQLSLQEKVLDQLLEIQKMEMDALDKAKKGLKGVGEALEDVEDAIDKTLGAFGAFDGEALNISSAFEDAKARIVEALGGIWGPIKERWEKDIQPSLNVIRDQFNKFFFDEVPTSTIPGMSDEDTAELLERMGEPVETKKVPGGIFGQIVKAAKDAFGDLQTWWNETQPLQVIVDGFNTIKGWLEEHVPDVKRLIMDVANTINGLSRVISGGISNNFVGGPMGPGMAMGGNDLVSAFKSVWDFLKENFDPEMEFLRDTILPNVDEAIGNVKDTLAILAEIVGIDLESTETTASSALNTFNGILSIVSETAVIATGAIQGIAAAVQAVINKLIALRDMFGSAAVQSLFGAGFSSWFNDDDTPSHAAGAWNLPHDELAWIHKGEMIIPASIAASIRSMVSGPSVSAPPVVSASNNVNVSFYGGINNGMDAAMMQSYVEQAISRGLT